MRSKISLGVPEVEYLGAVREASKIWRRDSGRKKLAVNGTTADRAPRNLEVLGDRRPQNIWILALKYASELHGTTKTPIGFYEGKALESQDSHQGIMSFRSGRA